MDIFWLLARWLHVIAAVVWIGGNMILAMVIVPPFRQNLPPVQRILLLTQIGKRFEPIVWGCIGVLFFTGIVNLFDALDLTSLAPISSAFMRDVHHQNRTFLSADYSYGLAQYDFRTPTRSSNRDIRPYT